MKELLTIYYAIQVKESKVINRKVAYFDDSFIYFPVRIKSKKEVYMEQATLAYHLVERGYKQTAFPVPNVNGDWITHYLGDSYHVLKVEALQANTALSHGKELALFHQANRVHQYQPQHISSYGQWKELWINKLTFFENKIKSLGLEAGNAYDRLLVNTLPYIIGISENAIQLIRESEQERDYAINDQATICFHRYQDQLLQPMIDSNQLVYDHPARDISSYIRTELQREDEKSMKNIEDFLDSYQEVESLSSLCWRMIYARLIYPIHLFDKIEEGFRREQDENMEEKMGRALEEQTEYEKRLKELFSIIDKKDKINNLPRLQWL